jgi:hypothetical protein
MKKEIIIDEIYSFERHKGYQPAEFFTPEDEIRDICEKQKILIESITPFDGYKVVGKKIRNRKTYEHYQRELNKIK